MIHKSQIRFNCMLILSMAWLMSTALYYVTLRIEVHNWINYNSHSVVEGVDTIDWTLWSIVCVFICIYSSVFFKTGFTVLILCITFINQRLTVQGVSSVFVGVSDHFQASIIHISYHMRHFPILEIACISLRI
jgi:hypothetical protein